LPSKLAIFLYSFFIYNLLKGGCKMAKLTAWIVTIVGLWLVLAEIGWIPATLLSWQGWIIAIAVLAIGIGKLIRNYSK
jgi:hypothetical protein